VSGLPKVTAAVALAAAAVFLAPGAFEALSWRRADILGGELWRLWTGHLTHGSFQHLAWDLAAFCLLGWQVEARLKETFALFLAACALAISAGLMVFLPHLQWYCGLSGLDTALFGWLALTESREAWLEKQRWLLALNGAWLAGLVFKVGYEYWCGQMLFVSTPGLPPVPAAHLLGALAGAAVFALGSRPGQRARYGAGLVS